LWGIGLQIAALLKTGGTSRESGIGNRESGRAWQFVIPNAVRDLLFRGTMASEEADPSLRSG
ncbi:MAG TPA: hypothetical protein PK743_13005, partial [Luteimonas sp.]|nr:hypothetical protein [Luteimonas sp.]HRP73536.1 hypothetical protein [Luteimonas sp.]